MGNRADYDGYLSKINSLTILSLILPILIIVIIFLIVWLFTFELKIKVILILLAVILIGLCNAWIKKVKSDLTQRFAKTFEIDLENDMDEFHNTIALYKKGEFEKIEAAFTNKKHTRPRGFDEKGLTGGKQSSSLSKNNQRVDAMKNTDYDDIVEEITAGETLLREADQKYAEISEKRWQKSEAADKDLIEAGVSKLGDLVKTEWFEKNAKDGAVKELYRDKDES